MRLEKRSHNDGFQNSDIERIPEEAPSARSSKGGDSLPPSATRSSISHPLNRPSDSDLDRRVPPVLGAERAIEGREGQLEVDVACLTYIQSFPQLRMHDASISCLQQGVLLHVASASCVAHVAQGRADTRPHYWFKGAKVVNGDLITFMRPTVSQNLEIDQGRISQGRKLAAR